MYLFLKKRRLSENAGADGQSPGSVTTWSRTGQQRAIVCSRCVPRQTAVVGCSGCWELVLHGISLFLWRSTLGGAERRPPLPPFVKKRIFSHGNHAWVPLTAYCFFNTLPVWCGFVQGRPPLAEPYQGWVGRLVCFFGKRGDTAKCQCIYFFGSQHLACLEMQI